MALGMSGLAIDGGVEVEHWAAADVGLLEAGDPLEALKKGGHSVGGGDHVRAV